MKVPAFPHDGRSPVDLTPMIDVVFLLIVFFTATNTMVKNEFSVEIDLPSATQGVDPSQNPDTKRITANILSTQVVLISGNEVTPEGFRNILQRELESYSADQIEVQFRADRQAPWGAVEPLMLACARAGVWQVNWSVKTGQ